MRARGCRDLALCRHAGHCPEWPARRATSPARPRRPFAPARVYLGLTLPSPSPSRGCPCRVRGRGRWTTWAGGLGATGATQLLAGVARASKCGSEPLVQVEVPTGPTGARRAMRAARRTTWPPSAAHGRRTRASTRAAFVGGWTGPRARSRVVPDPPPLSRWLSSEVAQDEVVLPGNFGSSSLASRQLGHSSSLHQPQPVDQGSILN